MTPEDHSNWMIHPLTQAVLASIKCDVETLKHSWSLGHLIGDEQIAAQGSTRCASEIEDFIRHALKPQDEVKV